MARAEWPSTLSWISIRRAQQPSQQRVLAHDLRVAAGVAGGGHHARQLVDGSRPADVLQLAELAQPVGDRQHVHRLDFVVQREHRLVDRAVALAVEVLRTQSLFDHERVQRPIGQQDRAEDRLLGVEVVRRRDRGTGRPGGVALLRSAPLACRGTALMTWTRASLDRRTPRSARSPRYLRLNYDWRSPRTDVRRARGRPTQTGVYFFATTTTQRGKGRPSSRPLRGRSGDRRAESRSGLLLRDDHRLDRRLDTLDDVDHDHVGADVLDRLGQVHACVCRVFRPRASRIAVAMSCAVTEPNSRPSAPACWGIVSTVRFSRLTFSWAFSIASRAARSAASWRWRDRFDRAPRGRLGELARNQVVAQVALRDVDHRCPARRAARRPCRSIASGIATRLPVAVAVAAVAPGAVVAAALVHVGQQRQLARALDGARDLDLVAPARARDPPRADLALLGDELAQRRRRPCSRPARPCRGSAGMACAGRCRGRPSCRAGAPACRDRVLWPSAASAALRC